MTIEITESEEQKEKIEKKWTEPKGPVGHHQVEQHKQCGSPRRRRETERDKETIWRNNVWKIPRFVERHKYKHQSSIDAKKDELKETHTNTHYNQTFKRQRILKAASEKQIITYKQPSIRLSTDFLSETLEAIGTGLIYSKHLKKKNCQSKILYPAKLFFNSEQHIKIFPGK